MTLHPITASDLSAIAAAEREIFSDAWSEGAIESFLQSAHSFGLMLLDEAGLCGYLLASCVAGEAELYRIATLPRARRRGVAACLMDSFLERVERERAERIFLEVRESNFAARRLYEAFDFSVIGKRMHYYQEPSEDAILYARSVENKK